MVGAIVVQQISYDDAGEKFLRREQQTVRARVKMQNARMLLGMRMCQSRRPITANRAYLTLRLAPFSSSVPF